MDERTAATLARTNLAALGVAVSDDDLERAIAGGFLATACAFDALLADSLPPDLVPDALTERLPVPQAVTESYRGAPSALPEILELAQALRRGDTTSSELVDATLRRIDELDRSLNAFQFVCRERALERARQADSELARGIDRGPLHGLPVAVKDLVDLAGTPTTAGSRIFADRLAAHDATLVTRLEAAGAVIVGKTRLPEFAYSGASNNPHFGPVRNPRAPARDTGGSSSGSAAAVAAGLVVMAIGTDTGGSIRIPAAYCGIVGLKPTFGRVSLAGVFPLAWSLDHAGPMTRTVADAAVSLAALAGPDPRDPRTRPAPLPDLVACAATERFEGRVAFVELEPGLVSPDVAAACEVARPALTEAGATVIELAIPVLAELRVLAAALSQMEAAAVHAPLVERYWSQYGDFFHWRLLSCFAYRPGTYLMAQRRLARARHELLDLMDRHGIDLLALPTAPTVAPPLGEWNARASWLTAPFNALGWPVLSVPVGTGNDGLPVGLQLVARPWREDLVLAAGGIVEHQCRLANRIGRFG